MSDASGSVSTSSPVPRLAVALDTADRPRFTDWCRWFGPRVAVLKVGLEAYCHWGPAAVEEAVEQGERVFLDLKLHDIPNTVAGAVAAVRGLGVSYLTLHAAGGPAMIGAAAEAAEGRVELLAVTLLTSLDEATLATLDLPGPGLERALHWAEVAVAAGAGGVVCSPLEAAALRARLGPEPTIVTPGIRPRSVGVPGRDDQRRVATPRQALDAGADLLVIGRPLTRAEDRQAALDAIAAEMS